MTPTQFATFYVRWWPDMVRYFGWKTREPQDAEDMTQDLFTSLAAHPERLDPATANRYLWVAAKHAAATYKSATHGPLTFDPIPDLTWNTPQARLFRLVERRMSTPSHAQAIVDRDAVKRELATLPPRERAVIQATVLNGDRLLDHARATGVSCTRIAQLRDRALTRLRVQRWRRS